ncbi:UvrABC system protein A [Novimethylophilus kurashikiensis]|uniref:UvrABC system protein A n=1 Tax=Novimethylophilus kurashikiensis TaxID=1825523 RepID=A0A2R5F9A2_9PROT|nr:glycosyltransferase [Novimethylophilus kurashikiensis]GBG14806.1 UvrABC system protein A [Novimethylophilus kurashikiensis]
MSLAVITTYYNPCRYVTRRKNYDIFMAGMRAAGVLCLTVECAFPGQDFELPPSPDVVQVRATTLLWQKERLLNMAAAYLPSDVKYVAWLDCDIVFDNNKWADDLVEVLKQHQVAQVFETAIRLDRDGITDAEPRAESFASVMSRCPTTLNAGRYDVHGHTGYGWAMRRELFDEVGLYEAAVSGSADHFMAHAIYDHYGFCIENALKHDPAQISHLKEWGDQFYKLVRGSLGVVPGTIRHLWHGDTVNRRYFLRMHEITDLGFNPYTDIQAQPGKPLEWTPGINKPGLEAYFANYFNQRQEDGDGKERQGVYA